MKKTALGIALLFSGFALHANAAKDKLKICMNDWPPNVLAVGLAKMGKLPNSKVRYTDYRTCAKRFAGGKTDVMMGTSMEYIELVSKGVDFKVVDAQDYSFGGDGVVLKKGLTSKDIKGKSFGIELNSTSLVALLAYLKSVGLELKDIKTVDIKAENLTKAITSGKVTGGVVTWSPTLQEMEKHGGKIVWTTKKAPSVIFDVTYVQGKALKNPAKVKALKNYMKQWHAAVDNKAVRAKAAEVMKISAADYDAALEEMYLYKDPAKGKAALDDFKKVTLDLYDQLLSPQLVTIHPLAKAIPKNKSKSHFANCCIVKDF